MALLLTASGIVALLGYRQYKKTKRDDLSTVTATLNSKRENGYQFRDITYGEPKHILQHPDVKNSDVSSIIESTGITDLGIYGTTRTSFQIVPGVSELTQIYDARSQYL